MNSSPRLCALIGAVAALFALFQAPRAFPATSAPPAALTDTLRWRLLGPFRGGWGEMVEGVPSRPDTFYFGAAGGGVWRTDNAGRTWRSLFDNGPTAPIGAIAVAPSSPETIYVGSGQPEPRYDVAAGAGVFKSIDGGRTWSALGLEATRHIGRIWIDPTNADHVLVAAVGHFFGPNPERGVFQSTDGGRTWSHTLNIDSRTGAVDLAADPANPRTVFAAAWTARQYPWQSYFTQVAGAGSGVYASADGGASWTRLGGKGWPDGPLGRISLAATRTAAGLRLYAVVSAEKASGLYRSDDGGAAWTRVNDDQAFTSYYASRVTVAPDDPDTVYLVGQSIRRCTGGGARCEIFKGAPGGDDYHHVWINPAHPDHMATSSDQGVVVSVDGGATWSSWYNQPTGQFYHLATDEHFPYRIYSGQQDSGTVGVASRGDYGAITFRDWNPVGGDERDYDIPDPDDPNIVYGSGLGGRISRWDARTGQSANITPFPYPNYGRRQTSTEHHFPWVTPLAISRAGPTTLYLGGEVVFASTDRGSHWRVVSPDLTGKQPGAERCGGDPAIADARACGYGSIWSLAPSPRAPGELWVGIDSGLVQMTRDGGAHWANVTPPGLPAWAKISSIDVSAREDGVAYVAVDDHRQDDFRPLILATRDHGATWRDASGDLPAGHFVSVARADPVRAGLLYAGTDVGVMVSFDDGARWNALRHNLPTAWVRDLLIHGDDLIAATQGRAIWVLGDLALLRQADAAAAAERAHVFAPADAVRVQGDNNRDTPAPPEEPAGENPPVGAVIDYWLGAPARSVVIEIRDAAGVLVQRLSSAPSPRPPAEAYFAPIWLHPPTPLATAAGAHRAVWNLRHERPAAIQYAYSIAAVAGRDTPIAPQGLLASPGQYQVSLIVDGKTFRQPLQLTRDPRTAVTAEDFAASGALSRRISDALALARRGYGEMAAARLQLAAALAVVKARPDQAALAATLGDLLTATQAPDAGPTFLSESGVLARIEADLEDADLAPTEPQTRIADQTAAAVETSWRAWSELRDRRIALLGAELSRAGARPVVIPRVDQLTVRPPEGGEDLP
ncbi:MAG TPA: hypothetical protein VFC47_05715 [Caulobacteraceae bacterium]|nr:hypothetical protein [Caulobacteraceae bacterium]